MSAIPQFRRLAPEDFPDQEEWIGDLMDPINRFFEDMVRAMDNGITFGQNLNAKVMDVIWSGSAKEIAWNLKARPKAAWIGQIVDHPGNTIPTLSTAVTLQWSFTQEGTFKIIDTVGLTSTPSAQHKLTIIAIAG